MLTIQAIVFRKVALYKVDNIHNLVSLTIIVSVFAAITVQLYV